MIAGKYRVDAVLGAGGMGIVLAATHVHLRQRVAIKLLHPEAAVRRGAVERFLREARVAMSMRGEHVVRIFDVGTLDDGSPFIAMECLEGRDLGAVLDARVPVEPAVAVDYILQASEALAEAHSLGVVHRDLKPANLFLTTRVDGTPCVKVLDFGVSKIARELEIILDETASSSRVGSPAAPASEPPPAGRGRITRSSALIGSPRYMAPEQIRAASDIDGRSDLFSVAVTIYETIAGASPFEATTPAASLAAVLESVVDPDPRIEPRVWIEVQRALGKRPYERHRDATEMASALRDAVGDSDVALASLLRRDPWERDALDDAGEQDSPRRGSGADAHLVEGARRRSLAPRSIGLAVAVGVGGLLVLASVFRSAGGTGGAAPPASAHAQSEVLPIPAPSVVGPSVEATSASDSPMGSASSGGEEGRGRRSRLPAVPLPPMHPRPVATTPGF
jgi:serine/threonine-protein kinase